MIPTMTLRFLATMSAMVLLIALGSSANADGQPMTFRTPPLPLDLNLRGYNRSEQQAAYVYCRIVATSTTPIGIVATIVSKDGTGVTSFGSGYRASPAATGDGLYHAEETAGSFDEGAWSCTATVTGARRGDVRVSLTAFDGDGTPIATVEAH